MPADPSGVTTDDQSPRDNEADDLPSAPTDGRTASSTTSSPDRGGAGDGPSAATSTSSSSPDASDGGRAASRPNGGVSGDPVPDPGPVATAPASGGSAEAANGVSAPESWPDPVADGTTQTTTTVPDVGSDDLAPGEPPPAPVLAGGPASPTGPLGPLGRRRDGRGRHASKRKDRASKRGLRVNQRLWSIDPWSVFKVSVLFYLCLGLIVLVAGTLLYNAGRRVGTIDQAESFVTRMGAYGECVPQAEVGEGAEFEEDDDTCEEGEVLVGGFALDDGTLFRVAAIGGTVLVVAGSIGNVLLTVLLNLLNELTGGLRHTVVKEPVARQPGNRSARSPGGPRPRRTGSPAREPQG
jgi:hypothetical protein